jgi:hypothetical protein
MAPQPNRAGEQPAFPFIVHQKLQNGMVSQQVIPGLSIRAYFAAKALQGLLARPLDESDLDGLQLGIAASTARQYADWLLEELYPSPPEPPSEDEIVRG